MISGFSRKVLRRQDAKGQASAIKRIWYRDCMDLSVVVSPGPGDGALVSNVLLPEPSDLSNDLAGGAEEVSFVVCHRTGGAVVNQDLKRVRVEGNL